MFQDAFTVLEFKEQEKFDVYKITAAVMHLGELKVKQTGREEQAEPTEEEVNGASCYLGMHWSEWRHHKMCGLLAIANIL